MPVFDSDIKRGTLLITTARVNHKRTQHLEAIIIQLMPSAIKPSHANPNASPYA